MNHLKLLETTTVNESRIKKILEMMLNGEIVFSVKSNEKMNEMSFDFAPKMAITTNHMPGADVFIIEQHFP